MEQLELISFRILADAAEAIAPNPAGNTGQRRVIRTTTGMKCRVESSHLAGVRSSLTPGIQEDPLC